MYNYLISGLHVSSQVELPGAIPETSQSRAADVSIRRGAVPAALDGATASGPTWELTGDVFLLRVPRVARFLITAGSHIAIDMESGVTDRDAAGFVLGSAFGILLHQRGALVLHGSAVSKDGRAIAICGPSGAGKSTLAAALCTNGCSLVTDDICVIGSDAQRRPIVLSDGRQMKLWKDAIERLDLVDRKGDAVRETFEKYYIDPSGEPAQASPLSAIYVLREARPPFKESIEMLSLPDAVRTLDREAYRRALRARIGQKPEMLAQSAALLGHTTVFLLNRQRGFEHLQALVAALCTHWDSLAL